MSTTETATETPIWNPDAVFPKLAEFTDAVHGLRRQLFADYVRWPEDGRDLGFMAKLTPQQQRILTYVTEQFS